MSLLFSFISKTCFQIICLYFKGSVKLPWLKSIAFILFGNIFLEVDFTIEDSIGKFGVQADANLVSLYV